MRKEVSGYEDWHQQNTGLPHSGHQPYHGADSAESSPVNELSESSHPKGWGPRQCQYIISVEDMQKVTSFISGVAFLVAVYALYLALSK